MAAKISGEKGNQIYHCPKCGKEAKKTKFFKSGKGIMAYDCSKCGIIGNSGNKLD